MPYCFFLDVKNLSHFLKYTLEITKLVSDARVSIYSDENSTPTTEKHNDKAMTNSSGFVTFDLNSFFVRQSEKSRDGYFYINASKEETEGSEQIRVTYQTTSVQTVYLNK